MKLKATTKGEESAIQTKEQQSKLGRRSKNKGANYERDTAKKFQKAYGEELVRTPQSGGFAKKSTKADDFRGDIVSLSEDVDLQVHIECKNAKTWAMPKWLIQAESDCPKGRAPIIVFHKHLTSKDYVVVSLEDFFKLVPKDNILKIRGVEK